ncbi:MaoC family dehydratase [Corallococcus llansteffanensis]|uniref:MaoC family dehydratase n=1 Tax=Corallococcus llansteffanensis TaxID=2316731 RepID=A0A3A8PKK2_9BACT|nr:MaoC family dehydratase [Corallococcus llansteffanensis]RKH56629.1 MaoC family dehydratase [Corallococcus llansteffanensis]
MRYFEDFPIGEIMERGPYVVTREEILAFARQFDPQPFHIDEDAARQSIYGGIIASGWHTAAICHKLLVEGLLGQAASMGSPGLDELRWKKPVRPGDALTVRIETLEARPSTSKPDRGALKFRFEVLNQHGDVVMTELATALFARRPAS